MTTDAQLNIDDKDALEFLERMFIKHKVVRDLLERIIMEESQHDEFAIFEPGDAYRDSVVKH